MDNFDAISDTAVGFSDSLMKLSAYVDGSVEKVIRKACIDLYRRIVERTPVDTGRAKGNWSLGVVPIAPVGAFDNVSFDKVNAIINKNVSQFKFTLSDEVVYITNNLDYIEYLENGTSVQAPAGMVVVSLTEFQAHFTDALRGLEGLESI